MTTSLLLIAAALLGGFLTLAVRWNERRLHAALALATGTFLGAVFLHLLPDVAAHVASHSSSHAATDDGADGHVHGFGTLLWLCVLAGVLLVHLVEAVYLRTVERDDAHRHESVGLITIAAVSVHAFSAGLGLAALENAGRLGSAFLLAFMAHKVFESFAVVNVFLLAKAKRRRIVATIVVFSLVTPAALMIGTQVLSSAGHGVLDVVTALATGTFLYVCVAELLPEVFHRREDNLLKSAFLVVGVALSVVFEGLGA